MFCSSEQKPLLTRDYVAFPASPSRLNSTISWTSVVDLSCEYSTCACVHVCFCDWTCEKQQHRARNVVSAATWTTVRRSRYQRTTSIRARRTSDQSASSCCGSWGKAVMERYLWCPRSRTYRRKYTSHAHTPTNTHFGLFPLYNAKNWISLALIRSAVDVIILNLFILFPSVQVFQVRKVVGAAAGKIFAMKVLKKVLFFFPSSVLKHSPA